MLESAMYPVLRPVNFQPVTHRGQTMWLLQDPFGLHEQQLIMPYYLARLAGRLDGAHSPQDLHRELCREVGQRLPFDVVTDALQQLDQFYLMENERSQDAIARVMRTYLAQPYRPPAFAGAGYPADPRELHTFLEGFGRQDADLARWPAWQGRAVVSPHIDYARGGRVYAQTWLRARQAVEDAELVLIWATDHNGGRASLTLSRLPYATPYGVLPTDPALVQQLADAIGPEEAFRLELNHRREHAVELAAVWLHHVRRAPCPVIPILIGSFHHFTPHGHPSQDPKLGRFLDALARLTAGKRVLSVASIDLAHVGPAFDGPKPIDRAERLRLTERDAARRSALARGDAEQFYRLLAADRNADNVCGFSPAYLMLRHLGPTVGREIAYAHCPADAENQSVVSICGMLLE